MKKMNTLLVSAAVLGVLAVPVQALAADGGTYNTRGLIEFEPSDGPTDPVDPEKPTDPVKPVDPIDPNKPVDPGTNGPLSMSRVFENVPKKLFYSHDFPVETTAVLPPSTE